MKKFTKFKSSFIFISVLATFLASFSDASLPKRIGALPKDNKNVQKVYLKSGLASVFLMPCPIEEIVLGKKKDFVLSLSAQDSKILNLSVLNSFTQATNLIVRCLSSTKFYVFDLLPHSSIHQDVVVIKRNLRARISKKELIGDSSGTSQIKDKPLRASLKRQKRTQK